MSSRMRCVMVICMGAVLCITQWSFGLISYGFGFISYPVLRVAEHSAAINKWLAHRRSLNMVQKRLITAEQKLAELTNELAQLRGMMVYSEETKDLRDFTQRYSLKNAVVGRVMARTCSQDEQSILVEAGASRGVQVDMIVLAVSQPASDGQPDNGLASCLVGRVESVFPHHCKIMLVTSKLLKVPVMCAETKTQGIYEGLNSCATARMLFASHLQPLVVGDMLLTSGDGITYPAGYGVGRIRSCSTEKGWLHHEVVVDPLCDVTKLTYVAIVDKQMSD